MNYRQKGQSFHLVLILQLLRLHRNSKFVALAEILEVTFSDGQEIRERREILWHSIIFLKLLTKCKHVNNDIKTKKENIFG